MSQAELIEYPFEFVDRAARINTRAHQNPTPVAIVGGGVAGLTAALALSAQGVACTVLEADRTVCFGSRAICFSRRTLEIFQRYGVADEIMKFALPWTAGRSYFRDAEVLRFTMPHDHNQKFAPMVNLEQFRLEDILVQALEARPDLVDLRWGCRVTSFQQGNESLRLKLEDDQGQASLDANWLLACDGGRSMVREQLGLALQGTAYEGRYVIVDIALESSRPTERLAWFDPPSNPGSTILMHKQPDNIWRIDYQLRDDQDAAEAVKPENVMPLVAAHLAAIGEHGAWSPIWISLYKANALALERFRHKRVLFAGDAAHLVPIFGVRGANSSIDDADNLAWKLSAVVQGRADTAILDSYSDERRFAAAENVRHGMKSTEFMAPPSFAFKLMREAVLDLALDHPQVRSLINPRQSSAITYLDSPLNAKSSEDHLFARGPRAGEALHCYPLEAIDAHGRRRSLYLTDVAEVGQFVLLRMGGHAQLPIDPADYANATGLLIADLVSVPRPSQADRLLLDSENRVLDGYDGAPGASYLIRPDGHVLGRWRLASPQLIAVALADALFGMTEMASP
jgi:3-(3-hydroxy-phenyl)propionate hydroxylase